MKTVCFLLYLDESSARFFQHRDKHEIVVINMFSSRTVIESQYPCWSRTRRVRTDTTIQRSASREALRLAANCSYYLLQRGACKTAFQFPVPTRPHTHTSVMIIMQTTLIRNKCSTSPYTPEHSELPPSTGTKLVKKCSCKKGIHPWSCGIAGVTHYNKKMRYDNNNKNKNNWPSQKRKNHT